MLSVIALWLVVTIRSDRVVDEIGEDAGGDDSEGAREQPAADDMDGVEVSNDH
jgi:hypothetical protein